jgi:hypothetical protein
LPDSGTQTRQKPVTSADTFDADNIVFAEIAPGLRLYQLRQNLAGIFQSVMIFRATAAEAYASPEHEFVERLDEFAAALGFATGYCASHQERRRADARLRLISTEPRECVDETLSISGKQ